VIARSIDSGANAAKPLLDNIAKAISGADSFDAARKAATKAIESHADDPTLSAMIADAALVSDLLGRLTVHSELGIKPTRATAGKPSKQPPIPVTASRDPVLLADPAFADLPWDEAVTAFKDRGLITDRDLENLIAGHDARGDEARKLLLQTVQANVHDAIERAMLDGTDFRAFQSDVQTNVIEPLGLSPADPWYLDTIMRTNVQSAYSAGRTAAQTSPEVLDAYPYWRKLVVGDGRTRPEHAALEGHVFRHGNPKTDKLRGTLGFNCRCADQPVSRDYTGEITEDVPGGFAFSPGWVR